MAASATLALKAGVWFRRRRLLIVSPDSLGTACPLSGRNSTYRPVQISAAGSMIRRGWGRIVFISTSLDIMMAPAFIAYGMTKACDEAYAAALAASLDGTGVTANVVLPGGPVATRMADPAGIAKGLLPPDIMAAPITWLASDASDHVTGRRFIAARWNSALTDAQAAQAAGAPAAWGGHRDSSIRPPE
ncbi:MAG TPA: SDR family oxidoreductase [Acidobacteriaceae bacterium]|nr:SDR family oxidoreductase [Acidobacteriaceae bacterium]